MDEWNALNRTAPIDWLALLTTEDRAALLADPPSLPVNDAPLGEQLDRARWLELRLELNIVNLQHGVLWSPAQRAIELDTMLRAFAEEAEGAGPWARRMLARIRHEQGRLLWCQAHPDQAPMGWEEPPAWMCYTPEPG